MVAGLESLGLLPAFVNFGNFSAPNPGIFFDLLQLLGTGGGGGAAAARAEFDTEW